MGSEKNNPSEKGTQTDTVNLKAPTTPYRSFPVTRPNRKRIVAALRKVTATKTYSLDEMLRYLIENDVFSTSFETGMLRASLPDTKWELKDVPVKDIVPHHQESIDENSVQDYINMKEDDDSPFPPLILVPFTDTKWTTVDGAHRLKAAKEIGEKTIPSFIPVRVAEAVTALRKVVAETPTEKARRARRNKETKERLAKQKLNEEGSRVPSPEEEKEKFAERIRIKSMG